MKFKVLGIIFLVLIVATVVSLVYYWKTDQQLVNYYLNNFIDFPRHKDKPPSLITDSDQITGTLSGHVDIGPNCPVEQVDNPCPPSQEAYEAVQIIIYTLDRGKIVTKTDVNSSGDYYTALAAGEYYVSYTSVYNFYQAPMKKVTIKADQTTTQDFSIDTGIR